MILPHFLTGQQSSKSILRHICMHKRVTHVTYPAPFVLLTVNEVQNECTSKWPTLEALASMPHSVGSKRKVSAWLHSSPVEPTSGAIGHPDATMVAKERSDSGDSGEPGEDQRGRTATDGGS